MIFQLRGWNYFTYFLRPISIKVLSSKKPILCIMTLLLSFMIEIRCIIQRDIINHRGEPVHWQFFVMFIHFDRCGFIIGYLVLIFVVKVVWSLTVVNVVDCRWCTINGNSLWSLISLYSRISLFPVILLIILFSLFVLASTDSSDLLLKVLDNGFQSSFLSFLFSQLFVECLETFDHVALVRLHLLLFVLVPGEFLVELLNDWLEFSHLSLFLLERPQ